MTDERRLALVNDLLALPAEMPWLEFKHNKLSPTMLTLNDLPPPRGYKVR